MKNRNYDRYAKAVELRRSNAAEPHVNKARYSRKVKHRGSRFDDSS